MTELTTYQIPLDSLEQEVIALCKKYQQQYHFPEILERIIKAAFVGTSLDNEIKTEYNDAYCDLFIDYASNYANANGFWGKYKIDEGVKLEWMDQHQRFKQTVALIPNITTHLMNENIDHVVKAAIKNKDVKTTTQICLKLLDVVYKTEKDSGYIKDRGSDTKSAKQRASNIISEEQINNAEEFLKNAG